MAHKPMSLEAAADAEMKEVIALLQAKPGARASPTFAVPARTGSPFANPQSPVRSMLDIGPSVPRHSSVPGANGTGFTGPPIRSMLDVDSAPTVRSMLDISTPLASSNASTTSRSTHASPTESNHRAAMRNSEHPRSLSDASSRPADFGPRAPGFEHPSPYQFSGYLQSNPGGPVVPKRNTQGGKKVVPAAMAEVVRGGDLSSLVPGNKGRNHSIAGTGIGSHTTKSKSPSGRMAVRTSSPHSSMLIADPTQFVTKDGRVIDLNNAYRRLSDANLAKSGGELSSLSEKSRQSRANSGDATIPEEAGEGRLKKEYTGDDEYDESSDEESRSSDEERSRGRKGKERENSDEGPESQTIGMGRARGPRTALSLMAAAEEERAQVAEKYKVKSLLDPEITITSPTGAAKQSRPVVQPNTAFDEAFGIATPVDSDTEADLTDIKRAQNMRVRVTDITSTLATKRCVQILYRGDFDAIQKDAEDHGRRLRKYVVATDLSDEANHALEWAVGTVLRDGDTLLAVYCVDEEIGVAPNDESADDQIKGQVAAIAKPMVSTPPLTGAPEKTPIAHGLRLDNGSLSASPMGRGKAKAEQERFRAVRAITQKLSDLVRKTKLQVKIVVEVVHCKSPRHLIVDVIDLVSPTMVVLGSRGRSALKGVILGSFSNYIVTKSSVPVMVARKKLSKHTKYKRPDIKLSNNLSNNPRIRSIASAKID